MATWLKKVKFIHFFWSFFYIFLFLLVLRGGFNYLDPDFGWHLQVGREIAQTETVPIFNQYNYSFTGTWVDHEWLSNLSIYWIFGQVGYPGLVIFFTSLIVLINILLAVIVRRYWPQVSPFLIIGLQLFGTIASLPHFGVRVQEIGVLFLFLLLFTLNTYTRRRNWLILLPLIPLIYLWSCLHGSFLIGLFIILAWAGVKSGEKIISSWKFLSWLDFSAVLKWRQLCLIFIFFGLTLGVTFFTPYKLSLYSFLGGYQNTFYFSRIQEWLSQFSYPFQYWQLLYLALAGFLLLLYLYQVRQKQRKANLWSLFLGLLFFVLSFKSRRHFPLFFVASFPLLIDVLQMIILEIKSTKGNVLEPSARLQISPWLRGYLLLCLCLAIAWQVVSLKVIKDPWQGFCHRYPCAAVTFLKSRPELKDARLFNDYGWGGYLIGVWPDKPLFIDGRLPQVEFAGHTFLEEYLEFFAPGEGIKNKLSEYQIQQILLPVKDQKVIPKKWERIFFSLPLNDSLTPNYLREYLSASQDWLPIYYDGTAIIYSQNYAR